MRSLFQLLVADLLSEATWARIASLLALPTYPAVPLPSNPSIIQAAASTLAAAVGGLMFGPLGISAARKVVVGTFGLAFEFITSSPVGSFV